MRDLLIGEVNKKLAFPTGIHISFETFNDTEAIAITYFDQEGIKGIRNIYLPNTLLLRVTQKSFPIGQCKNSYESRLTFIIPKPLPTSELFGWWASFYKKYSLPIRINYADYSKKSLKRSNSS